MKDEESKTSGGTIEEWVLERFFCLLESIFDLFDLFG